MYDDKQKKSKRESHIEITSRRANPPKFIVHYNTLANNISMEFEMLANVN